MPWLWGAARSSRPRRHRSLLVAQRLSDHFAFAQRARKNRAISRSDFCIWERTLRISPLYFLIMTTGLVFARKQEGSANLLGFSIRGFLRYYVLGYVLFITELDLRCFRSGAIDLRFELWTVSIEEQFYLLWPAVMKKLDRRGMIIAASLTIVLSAASQVGLVLVGVSPSYMDFGTHRTVNSLALGILIAPLS